jgi:hypothetical protein
MSNTLFEECLAYGETYEQLFANIIHKRLPGSVATKMRGNFKKFDFNVEWTNKNGKRLTTPIEVKADRKALETGNIVIEYEGYGRPSGISTTTAVYWAYFVEGTRDLYFIPVKWIREAIANMVYNRDISGGHLNATRMYVFALKDIPTDFRWVY